MDKIIVIRLYITRNINTNHELVFSMKEWSRMVVCCRYNGLV